MDYFYNVFMNFQCLNKNDEKCKNIFTGVWKMKQRFMGLEQSWGE